ncbi:Ig-like domain-containing protein [Robiginitalea sp. M366]|uniref:Ig-like domain-containing protein n=1 Tax=Robiginitalea aestuariiviva TaxID=3036903 RepID=UPI00240E04E3|nr:Ig-like domain-containing protein [Robiginitalea aestuariiviva]MDG1572649.1 Ig-like domain-containing protein [Robiginitalea aestuariiviva]
MKLRLLLISSLCSLALKAQYRISDGSELLDLQQLPMEKMYVHLSQSLLFTGEYLYYKAYVLNAQTNKLSRISTLAYVRLVDAAGQTVFEHKLRLEGGMGQGDYFLNTDIPSGVYKLLGYTQWMENAGLEQLFQADVAIINPYRPLPDADGTGTETYSVSGEELTSGASLLQLELDTTQYARRSRVKLQVRNYKGALGYGQYSLSVTRRPELSWNAHHSAEAFGQAYFNAARTLPQGIGDSVYLPEQRGELLFGRVSDAATGQPAPNQEVVLSVPGKDYILKSATTDAHGYFFTYLRKAYAYPGMICQVAGPGTYTISRGAQRPLPWEALEVPVWKPAPDQGEAIRRRSIHNQLENAFFGVKPDSVLQPEPPDPFDGGIPQVKHLDEYTRFETLQETLVELFGNVGYRKGPDGSDYIRVAQDFEAFNEPYNNDPAIVLIDGVFIPDPGRIKGFKARRIQTIRVLQDPLVLGPKTYQGILSIETFTGDYAREYQAPNATEFRLDFPQAQKRYYKPDYREGSDKIYRRVPDYRYLLHWEPQIDLDSEAADLEFYTSDLEGTYEIILEGFTTYGKPVSVRRSFQVDR